MTSCKEIGGKLDRLNNQLSKELGDIKNRVRNLEKANRNKPNNENVDLEAIKRRLEKIERYIVALDRRDKQIGIVFTSVGNQLKQLFVIFDSILKPVLFVFQFVNKFKGFLR